MSTPVISLSAIQLHAGDKSVRCTYTLSSIDSGAIREFYVKRPSVYGFIHLEDYDDSVSNGTTIITLDFTDVWTDYGDYVIRLWVYNSSAEEDSDYEEYTVTLLGNRPNNFTFPSSVRSGAATTTLTASKWNDFQDRINEFQAYKGVTETSFYDVDSGDAMTASLMRKAWDAINGISGHGTMPTRPTAGATIYASWFHDLADALNEIE